MQTWMMTIARRSEKPIDDWCWTVERICSKKLLSIILEKCDAKRWIIAIERGKNGYDHYQIRLSCSDPDFFEHMKEWCEWAWIQKAETDQWDYERKEGRYWTSEDTIEIRKCRFGSPKKWQRQLMEILEKQDVRTIDTVLDPVGSRGKTWLTVHLWETGQALVVPRYATTPEKLSAFVCSAYKGEPIIIIDIPRASKPTTALYETMEEIKDGLVFDPRYSGRAKDIRGVKLVVFTNKALDLKQLSHDRWNPHGITIDGGLS